MGQQQEKTVAEVESAYALARAPLQSSQPPKDRVFYARHHVALKWAPYKPNSQEVKRGKMGRWQELRPYGIGWQNSDVTPQPGAWVEDVLNRPELLPTPNTPASNEAPGRGGVWQPIETAPKDGTRVLLGGGRMFCESLDQYITEPTSAQWDVNFWLVVGTEGGYVCAAYDDPTHWMPLPAAPAPETEA